MSEVKNSVRCGVFDLHMYHGNVE